MTVQELREAIDYLADCLRDIHQRGVDEERSLSDDEQQAFDEGVAERDRLQGELDRAEHVEKMLAEGRYSTGAGDGSDLPNVNIRTVSDATDLDALRTMDPTKAGPEYRGRAIKAVESRASWELDDASKERITVLLERHDVTADPGQLSRSIAYGVLVTGHPDYERAFEKYIRTVSGGALVLNAREQAVVERAMSLTTTAGGFRVPFPIDPTLINLGDGARAEVRRFARVVPNHMTDTWQGVATTQLSASFDAEAAEVSDDTTTFSQPSITVRTARAFVPASFEIVGDYPGLVSDLNMLFVDAKANLEATVFATGAAGSNQPIGIVTALTDGSSQIDSITTDTFAVTDVFAVADALPPRYRSQSSRTAWCSNIAALHDIREFGDAGNPGPFVQEANNPAVLGYPWFEMSGMDSSITALSDNKFLVYGDWRHYVIVDRVGFQVEVVPHLFNTANNLPDGQRGFLGWWRTGADSVNDNAFVMLDVT